MDIGWFTLFFSAFTAAIGFFGNMLYEHKKQLRNKATEERRSIYSTFSDIMIDRIRYQEGMTEELLNDIINRMFNFYKDYLLYASTDVINAIGDLQQFMFQLKERLDQGEDPESIDKESSKLYLKYSRIIYEMREDLGLPVKELGEHGKHILKSFLSNYYSLYPQNTTDLK